MWLKRSKVLGYVTEEDRLLCQAFYAEHTGREDKLVTPNKNFHPVCYNLALFIKEEYCFMWKHTNTIILTILTEIVLHIIPQSFLLNLPKETRAFVVILTRNIFCDFLLLVCNYFSQNKKNRFRKTLTEFNTLPEIFCVILAQLVCPRSTSSQYQ